MNINTKDILVRMLTTPNPYALKFVLNTPIKNTGRATFYSKNDCTDLPLFYSLFDISGLKQIFVFQNQITLTHEGILDTQKINTLVTSIVKQNIENHNPDFVSFEEESKLVKSKTSPPRKRSKDFLKIEEILDRTIRPGLQADGGDLEVLSVTPQEVRITYQGACGGCPSALMGTLEAIENILREETNQPDLKVIPI